MNNRIFISGPITASPDYRDNFRLAKSDLIIARRKCNEQETCTFCPFYDHDSLYVCTIHDLFPHQLEVVDPTSFGLDNKPWLLCMAVCVRHLLRCSYVFMLHGWQNSRGARIEHWLASLLHKQIIYQK